MTASCPTQPPLGGQNSDHAAAYWLSRMKSEEVTNEDCMAFRSWHAASEANALAYAKAEGAWAIFDGASDDPMLQALRASALASGPPVRKRWPRAVAAIAASLIIAIGSAWLTTMQSPEGSELAVRDQRAYEEYFTKKGENRTLSLADGSKVTLNTDSVVRIAYTADRRLVYLLRGQALFEVAKHAGRPFIVDAGDQMVTALGTVFEVRIDHKLTKVTLIEGKVIVDPARSLPQNRSALATPKTLKPGEAMLIADGGSSKLVHVDLAQQLRWREGFVEFHDVALEAAVQEMNRYSTKPLLIRFADPEALRVSGVFRTGNNERFASIIAELLPITPLKTPEGNIELYLQAEEMRRTNSKSF